MLGKTEKHTYIQYAHVCVCVRECVCDSLTDSRVFCDWFSSFFLIVYIYIYIYIYNDNPHRLNIKI